MFFSYLGKELRRRRKQALVVATGLGVGVGLVVAVSAMSAGVNDAQDQVLASLYGIGTDLTVTQQASPNQPPDGGFQVGGQDKGFARDRLVMEPGQDAFPASRVDKIAGLDGVGKAAGAMALTDLHLSGDLPTIRSSGPNGNLSAGAAANVQAPAPGEIDIQTAQVIGLDLADTSIGQLGSATVTDGRLFTAGEAKARLAVLDASYAQQEEIAVGDTVKIAGRGFEVIGLVKAPVGGAGADVFIPLAQAQDLSGLRGKVNTVYVQATDATTIDRAKGAIKNAFPDATVSTSSDLASQVTGSLASASSLATSLGRWLSIAALAAAVVLASLLTLSSVARRTRELGTLKAIGWRSRRVVGQVLGESVVVGLAGAVIGIAIGLGAAWAIGAFGPSLTASVTGAADQIAVGPPGGGNPFADTVSVALRAPVSAALVLLAIALSIAGGSIAGLVGGWRAARMRPAEAMRQLV